MNKIYAKLLIGVLFVLGTVGAKAQSSANYTFATATTGSLALDINSNAIDMTTGTTSLIGASIDDGASSLTNLNLGVGSTFEFYLMGTRYANFGVSSNGILTMGATTGTTVYALPNSTVPTISAFANDMQTGSDGNVIAKVVGTAPNRTLVLQWTNIMIRFGGTPATGTGTWQVRLYESTGAIEYVYGAMTTNTATPAAYYVGFSINTTVNNVVTVNTTANTASTSATVTSNSYTASSTITQLNSAANGSRRFYRFTPPGSAGHATITSLAAPTVLNFTSVTATTMSVNWTASSPITGIQRYAVYNSTDGGTTYNFVSTVTVGTNTLAVTGLTLSTTYTWKVNAVSEGALSSSLTGTQATTAAATYFWVGASGADWNTAASWNTLANNTGSTRSVAATTDILIVDGMGTTAGLAGTISVSANASIGALQITNSTAVTIQSLTTTTRTITLTGSVGDELSIPSGSSIILNNATQAAAIAFSTGTGMTGTIAGTLTFAGSTSNTLTTTGGTSTVVTVTGTGIVNLGAAGNSLVGSAATLIIQSAATVNSSGATTGAPPVPLATWGATSNLIVTGLTTSTTGPTNNAQTFGNLTYNCPSSSGTISWFTTSTSVVQGDLTITATGTGIFRAVTTGTLTINGNVIANGGTFQSASSTGTLIVSGNTTIGASGKIDILAGTYSQRGTTFTNNGVLTGVASTSTLYFFSATNTAQTYTGTGTVLTNLGVLSVQNGGGLTISTTNTSPVFRVNLFFGSITGSNLITIGTGAAVACTVQVGYAGSVTLGGSFATSPTFNLGTGAYTLLYQQESALRTTGFAIPPTRTVTNLTIDNTNGVSLAGGDLTISGILTLTSGQFAIGANILTLSGSPITGTGVATNLITTSSSSLVFSGSTTGQIIPASVTTLNGLTLNNSGASGITPNGPLSASSLVLTTGKLNTTTTNILTVTGTGASAITGGSTTAYVNGPLQRTLPASLSGSNTYLMPIGKTGYNPFDLINPVTNAGGTVVVKAEVFDAPTGGTSGTNMGALNTNRYWSSSFTSGAANFSNTAIRITDVSGIGSANGIGQSSTLTGSYNLVSSAAPVAGAITSDNINSISFFVMGVINIAATDYYSKATGNLDDLTSWGTNTDGSGTNPANFTNNGQTFNIRNNATPTIGAAWTVSGAGSKAVLGDGTNPVSFTIPASFAMSGLLNVSANSTLTLNNDAVPTLGTVNTNSTIEYAGAGSQNIAGVTYGNLISSNTGARVLANTGTVGIAGTFTTGTNVYTVTGSTVDFNGTVAQNIPAFAFNNLTISNTAGATQIGDVSVAGILLVNQNLTVNAATTLTLASGSTTTIASAKQLTVNGTILNNSTNAITLTGTLVFITGSLYQHNVTTATIPAATYNSGSLLKVTGATAGTLPILPTTIGGNAEWNSPGQTLSGSFIGTTCSIAGNLTIISTGTGGTAGFISNGFTTTARTLNITGNLIMQGGNYFISGTSGGTVAQLTTAANVSVSGGQLIMNTGSGSAGSGTLTIGAAGNLTLTGGILAINNSTASTGTATLTIPGNLNMSAGTFSIAGGTGAGSGAATLNVAGNANISGGTFNMTTTTGTSAATFNLQGNFAHSAGTFTRNSNAVSTLVINGTLAQSITTTGFTVGGGTGEHSLTVNNSAGFTLNSSVQIGGTLTLTSGLVNTTAANLLSLGNATTAGTLSGGSSTSYINGPFARTFAASRTASGTYTVATLYPVGKNATYLPLYIDPTTTAGGAVIMNGEAFTTNSGTAGVGVSTLSANRWEALISSGSGNFTSTNLRIADGTNIVATSQIFQATSAAGAYTTIIPTSTYAAGPPNTLTTTGSQILAANYSGYFAYGDAACTGANAGTATAAASNFCLTGSTTISAAGYTIATGITYQWQSATDLAFTTPVDIGTASSTYANLNTGTITSTTYYRLKVICGPSSTTAYTTTPATVIVNNPSVATTTPGTRCGTGTVTLGATMGGNATALNWYAASSGGTALGTGTSFITPSISSNTPYFVAASTGTVSSNLGNTAIPSSTGASAERGIVFTANQSFTLVSAQYYSPTLSVTNTVTVRLVDNGTGTQIGSSLVLPIVQGASAGFYTMNLNLSITPGTYRLLAGFSSSVNRHSSGADYTNIAYNNLGVFGSITSGYDAGVSATSYNYFHNILIQSAGYCESARTSVLATVNTPPTITATGTATICSGLTTPLNVTSANDPSYTYTWTPGPLNGASQTVSPSTTTIYTVNAVDNTAGPNAGCATSATVTITVNPTPTGVTATASPATLCAGNNISLTSAYTASSIPFSGMDSYTATRTTGASYTSIIPATTITSWRNTFSTDDNLSDNQPIGFSFSYNGNTYTNFRVSTNGFITFNTTSTAIGNGASNPYSYTNDWTIASAGSIVAPNWDDLQTAANAGTQADLNNSINYTTTGSAGSRVLTVEWKNMQDFATTSNGSYNFQVKLFEADGHIELVYGTMTVSTNTPSISYSLGLSAATVSTTPTAPQLLSQTTQNTATFGFTNSTALATIPATNTKVSFNLPQPVYSWTGPNGFTSSAANPTITSATTAASGIYNLVVSNPTTLCASAQASTVTVTVNQPAAITMQPTDANACSAAAATFTVVASGTSVSYQWQESVNGGTFSNISNGGVYSGATSASLSISDVTGKNGNRYQVVVTGTSACTNTVTSNPKTLNVSNTWVNSGTDAWATGSNWSCNVTPGAGDNVIIPGGGTQPLLPSNITVGNIAFSSNATITIGSNTLTINGAVSGSGSLSGSSTSNLIIGGTAGTLYFTSGSRILKDLTLNASATATLGTPLEITAGASPATNGTVIIGSGATLASGGNLTIKSNEFGTARVGNSAGTITGNVTVERFIPQRGASATGGRAYRLMASTVNTTGTIRANWMEGGLVASVGGTSNLVPGYGTHITGNSGNTNNFDVTQSNAPSLYLASNGTITSLTYTPVGSTTTGVGASLNALTGYFLYIRGDRSVSLQVPLGNNMPTTSTTLRTTGTLVTGPVSTFTNGYTGGGAHNLVTNPYPSPIDWSMVQPASSGITDFYTYWNPNFGDRGAFVTVNKTELGPTRYIQSGQAFFVESNGAVPVVNILESHKASGNNNGVFLVEPPPVESFKTELYFTEANGFRRIADRVTALYDNAYSAAVDSKDAKEIGNWDENIAIFREGKRLAIEGRPVIMKSDDLPIYMNNMKKKAYEIEFTPLVFTNTNLKAELIDNYLGTRTLLSVVNPTVVSFTITDDAASKATDRFKVVFGAFGSPTGVDAITIKASQKNNGVQVDWTSKTETDMVRYEVEKSTYGTNFVKANSTIARGNSTTPVDYNWFDTNPNMGTNFYRVKGIDKAGNVRYSEMVRVLFGKGEPSIVVYPNPMEGRIFKMDMYNLVKGTYVLNLYSNDGRLVHSEQLQHDGSQATRTINLKGDIAKGAYQLQLMSDNGFKTSKILIKN